MPGFVANLTRLSLVRIGLAPSDPDNEIILSSLQYEAGPNVSLVVMCIEQAGPFGRARAKVAVSIADLTEDYRAKAVFDRGTIDVPTSPHDIGYLLTLTACVKAMVHDVAAREGWGRCLNLSGPLPGPKGDPWAVVKD